jgi:hypothetical protein
MAAGDISRDSGFPRQIGNMWLLTGTLEADSTARTFALTSTKNTLVACMVQNADDDDTYIRVTLNSNDGTAGTLQGAVRVQTSSGDDDTCNFLAIYI